MPAPESQTSSATDVIAVTCTDKIATIRLNQPKSRNALSSQMMTAVEKAFLDLGSREDVGVIILEAAGSVFSSGHNLKEVMGDNRKETMTALFNQCSQMMQTIVNVPIPVIAKINGAATAAGSQLVASCDLAFASKTSRFATPGVNIGLFCSTPMVALSRNVSPKHAMEMLLTGEFIDADHAARIGLINRAVEESELDSVVEEFAARIASKSTLTVRTGKTAFYKQLPLSLEDAYAYTSEVMAENMQSLDAKEGISAFLEKRDPKWQDK